MKLYAMDKILNLVTGKRCRNERANINRPQYNKKTTEDPGQPRSIWIGKILDNLFSLGTGVSQAKEAAQNQHL